MYELLKCDIMNENFRKLISTEQSEWLKDAERRQKWKLIRKPVFRLSVKYYRLKRAFLLFIHSVIWRFSISPQSALMITYLIILFAMLLLLLHPFIEYFTGFEMFPKFYD